MDDLGEVLAATGGHDLEGPQRDRLARLEAGLCRVEHGAMVPYPRAVRIPGAP
jgi:hypothetical protein